MSGEKMERTLLRMEQYDGLPPQGRALVREFGMNIGMHAARQFYGRWDEARQWAEQQRQIKLPPMLRRRIT